MIFGDGKVIDDTNINSDLLGVRRLKTPIKPKFILNRPVFEMRHMFSQPNLRYIDSVGKLFKYKKKYWVTIKYLRIKKVLLKDTCCILTILGLNYRITIQRPPPAGYRYAGIIYLGPEPWQIYNFAESDIGNKRKKI